MTQERSLYVLRLKEHLVLSCRPCHFASGFVCWDRSRRPKESKWRKKKLHFYGSPKVSLGDISFPLKYERSRSKFSPLASCYDSRGEFIALINILWSIQPSFQAWWHFLREGSLMMVYRTESTESSYLQKMTEVENRSERPFSIRLKYLLFFIYQLLFVIY